MTETTPTPEADDDALKTARTRWITFFDRWWEAGRFSGHWTAKIAYDDGWFKVGKKGKIKRVGPNGRGGIVAYVTIQWQYRTADIHVSLPAAAQLDDDELERYVVHELLHFFLSEMACMPFDGDGPNPHEEHAVAQLTNFVFAVRDAARGGGLPEPQKESPSGSTSLG